MLRRPALRPDGSLAGRTGGPTPVLSRGLVRPVRFCWYRRFRSRWSSERKDQKPLWTASCLKKPVPMRASQLRLRHGTVGSGITRCLLRSGVGRLGNQALRKPIPAGQTTWRCSVA